MLQVVCVVAIASAWTLPALFLLTLAGLFATAVLRPAHQLWARGWEAVGRRLEGLAVRIAARVQERSLAYVRAHPRR